MPSASTATVERPSSIITIPAVFNLDDANEARIQKAIQIVYAPESNERLHAIRRGAAKGLRMAWTLGSFHPVRPNARPEWSVLHWAIDEISVRVQRCKDEAEARAAFGSAGQPDPQWPGIKFPPK